MKKILSALVLLTMLSLVTPVFATEGRPGEISGRSVGAAALSLFIGKDNQIFFMHHG